MATTDEETRDVCLIEVSGTHNASGSGEGGADYYRLPCTASDDRACRINQCLRICNELLFKIYLQLRELPGTKGFLSLVSVNEDWPKRECPSDLDSYRGTAFLQWLLRTHACIVNLDLGVSGAKRHGEAISEILRQQPSLKILKVMFLEETPPTGFETLLPRLTYLVEFECSCGSMDIEALLLPGLSTLLWTTSSLASIKLDGFAFIGQQAERFVDAIAGNTTLKFLELGFDCIELNVHRHFAECVRDHRSLTSLSVHYEYVQNTMVLDDVILAIGRLSALHMDIFMVDTRSIYLLSQIVCESDVLKKLTILNTCGRHLFSREPYTLITEADYKRWAQAMTVNETLEELSLPYTLWDPKQWIAFFALLPRNKRLKNLHVTTPVCRKSYETLLPVLEALEESRSSAEVSFGTYHHGLGLDLMKFRAFKRMRVGPESDSLRATLQRLPALDHFTSLSLVAYECNTNFFSSLAKYIQKTSVLRRLQLRVNAVRLPPNTSSPCWRLLLDSISLSTSIENLSVFTNSRDDACKDGLADTVRCSRNITRVVLRLEEFEAGAMAFVVRLSKGIDDNYNLLDADLGASALDAEGTRCWLTISETTRRNSGLLARAAAVSQTTAPNWYNAAALEEVSRHPALVRELAKMEGIAPDEMARLLRSRLRSVEGMHDFMRLTGVVKERVTCAPPVHGCSTQLQDLNSDCWALVRRYLSFNDVKYPRHRQIVQFRSS